MLIFMKKTCLRYFLAVVFIIYNATIHAQIIDVNVSVDVSKPGIKIKEDFVGFSMEQYSLSTGKWGALGSFWTGGTNGSGRLKNLLSNISPHSVIRLGGFTADDRMVWQNTTRGTSTNVRATYTSDTDKFFIFLKEIGWKGIYTIKFPDNSPSNAASEAAYIYNNHRDQLLSISMGNEPYSYYKSFKQPTYTPENYMADYLPMYDAIKSANPAIPISGCDCGARQYVNAGNEQWNKVYTDNINNSGSTRPLASLNVHNYGLLGNALPSSPYTPEMLANILMDFDNAPLIFSKTLLPYVSQLAPNKKTELRFTETSSSAGVSDDPAVQEKIADTHVTAIWALQYLYVLASNGISGVNFHSPGTSKYSAIFWGPGTATSSYPVGAIYYGLLAFTDGGKNMRILPTTPQTQAGSPRAAYYSTISDNGNIVKVTVINKDFTNTINAVINIPGKKILSGSSRVLKTQDNNFYATTTTTYGGSQVGTNGIFSPTESTSLAVSENKISVAVAPMTASVVTVTLSSNPLPVNLISFSGKIEEKNVVLDWITTSETNNNGFEIQKSNDAKSFQSIGFVKGNYDSKIQNNYSFTDKDISDFGNIYYRLKQIDNDGAFEYSRIITVSGQELGVLTVFPNPSDGNFTLSIKNSKSVELQLISMSGIEIPVSTTITNQPEGIRVRPKNALQSGFYQLKVISGDGMKLQMMKVVVE